MASELRLVMVLAALMGAQLVAWPAAAEPTAPEKDAARTLMKKGDAKSRADNYAAALKDYKAADEIMAVPSTRVAVGRTQMKLGQLVEARDTFLSVARIPKRDPLPPAFAKARLEAEKAVGALDEMVAAVKFEILGAAEGTDVTVKWDGKPIPAAALGVPWRANPGKHTVTATAVGFEKLTREIELSEGDRQDLALELQPKKAGSSLSPTQPQPPSGDSGGGISPVAWAGFAIGGAGILAGAITGGIALSNRSILESDCKDQVCLPDMHDDLDKTLLLSHISTASFAVGGAGVALGLIGLFALSGGDKPKPDAASSAFVIYPVAGPGFTGVVGSF